MQKNILVTGSLASDVIMDFNGSFSEHIMPDKIHKINLSFLLHNLKRQNGGTAGNIAYNLALLGNDVSILAAAGNDFSSYLEFLKKAKVNTATIKIFKNEPTATAFIMTDLKDNQITGFYPGAMKLAAKLSISECKLKPDFVIISPNDPKALIKYAKECKKLNIPFMSDIGMILPALSSDEIKSIIEGSEIVIGNDYEIDLLKEKTGLSDEDILQSSKVIITTLGEKGSVIKTTKQEYKISAGKPLKVLDPTGAGDAFRAGFMTGFIKGLDLKICAQMGSVASCYTIEKYGTTTHTFSKSDFEKRYKQNYKEDLKI